MGLKSTKSSLINAKYSLTLLSADRFYRGLSIIQGEFQINIRRKLRVEKTIRIDLIGQLIENNKSSSQSTSKSSQSKDHTVFFTYSFPIVTSHENGIARIIKNRHTNIPFRIPLSINLPPSCEFKEFSVVYYLYVYHDERLLTNIRKKIILAPPTPLITEPLSRKVTGSDDMNMVCSLQRSFYSGRDSSTVLLSISIKNPKQKQIQSVVAQLMQVVSLNEIKFENEIFTNQLKEINENTQESLINTTCELNLPSNLPPTYIPNGNGQPDNVPCISITYALRLTTQIQSTTKSNLHLTVPIGIE
ncbi:unnamed protein product [Rotaria socialis]|uniref:Arrestin C-terminal-like domain-containing protein n=1 Tax=Rotaria socialis TaxID=392032 RepID=A0A818Q9U1_9BILA|nr:unnamed protein product [Rotaria socialis]CAF3523187.1 unnamed protein product [Rotaria socialis]CAF3534168.1 unnamed protein product [Rotaria socialis]CAF3633753.1 unnamed protein product [Rotaria socialis]CAF4135678.1 unnamed protein product [Rotaria socialis]